MPERILFLVGLGGCITISVLLRMQMHGYRSTEFIGSPLSEALTQLVGISGGIYVAFLLLFDFLEIEFPQKVSIYHVSLNPLAFISVLLACAQPLISFLWRIVQAIQKHGMK